MNMFFFFGFSHIKISLNIHINNFKYFIFVSNTILYSQGHAHICKLLLLVESNPNSTNDLGYSI